MGLITSDSGFEHGEVKYDTPWTSVGRSQLDTKKLGPSSFTVSCPYCAVDGDVASIEVRVTGATVVIDMPTHDCDRDRWVVDVRGPSSPGPVSLP